MFWGSPVWALPRFFFCMKLRCGISNVLNILRTGITTATATMLALVLVIAVVNIVVCRRRVSFELPVEDGR